MVFRARLWLALLAVVLTLGVTGAAVIEVQRSERRVAAEATQRVADAVLASIAGRAEGSVEVARSVQGLLEASSRLEPDGFSVFATHALTQPSVEALSYSPRVAVTERARWERENGRPIRDEGGSRTFGTAFPVTMLVTREGTRLALGFDHGSDPVRRDAVLRAIRSGAPAATPPLTLQTNGARGVVVFTPVFDGGEAPADPAARERAVRGVAGSNIDTRTLLADVLTILPRRGVLLVRDGDLHLAGRAGPGVPAASRTLTVAGRTWTVEVWMPEGTRTWTKVVPIALLGLVSALIAASTLLAAARRQRAAEALLSQQTRAREDAERRGRESEMRFQTLLNELPTGVFQMDSEGEMEYVNPSWSTLTGLTLEQARHGGWVSVIHPDDLDVLEVWETYDRGAEPSPSTFRFRAYDGTVRWVDSSVARLLDPDDGRHRGWIGSISDITDRRIAEARLAESEEQMRSVVENIVDAILVCDGTGIMRSANPAAQRLFGYTADEMVGADVRTLIAPEHHADLHDAYVSTYGEDGSGETTGFARNVYAVARDGTAIPAYLAVSRSGDDDSVRFTVVLRDLTSEVAAEEHMRRHAMEQDALREVATIVATQGGPEETAACAAHQAAWIMEVPLSLVVRFEEPGQATLVGAGSPVMESPVEVGAVLQVPEDSLLSALRETGEGRVCESGHGLWPDETGMEAVALAVPVLVDDRVWGAMLVCGPAREALVATEPMVANFTSLISLAVSADDSRTQLALLASSDPLTGLPNRRAFLERIEGELERAQRYGRPLSLVVFDIDHFKRVNDTHGHDRGDLVLQEVANRVSNMVRTGELVARIGGEEFAWILPETDGDGAMIAANRARRAIGDYPIVGVGTVTASFGLCDISNAPDGHELYRRADKALYLAKAAGRDTVMAFDRTLAEVTDGNIAAAQTSAARDLPDLG